MTRRQTYKATQQQQQQQRNHDLETIKKKVESKYQIAIICQTRGRRLEKVLDSLYCPGVEQGYGLNSEFPK